MDNEWVDIDEWEDISSTKKSPLDGFLSLAKGAVTPIISEETAKRPGPFGEALRMAGRTLPTTTMISPLLSSVVPPIMREQMAPKQISEQTSPLQILSNLGVLGVSAKKARMLPEIMNKQYTLKNAEMGATALSNIRNNLGKIKEKAISVVANVPVNTNEVPLNNLPKTVMNALEDPLYGIEKNSNGIIRNTVSNMDKVKEAIGDFMTTKTWEEASNKSQQVIKQVYGKLNNAMKEAAKNAGNPIDEVLDNYHNFMTDYSQVIKTVKDTAGNIVEKPLRGAFKPFAERGKQEAWQRLGKQSPEISQMIKNMKKYTGRKATQAALGGLGGLGLLSYMAHKYISSALQKNK